MDHINKEELINYHNIHPYKKLQDLFPVNLAAKDLEGIYNASDDGNSFYINTPCIVALDKTIIKNKTYLLLDLYTDDHQIEEYRVKLLDAVYHDGSVNLLVQDIETDKKRIISQFLDSHTHYCPWFHD